MLGASFEWLCAFFCEIIGISYGTERQNFPLVWPRCILRPRNTITSPFLRDSAWQWRVGSAGFPDREEVLELLPQLRDGLEPRTPARRSRRLAAAAARAPRAAAGRRRAIRVAVVATRAHQQVAGSWARALGDILLGFQIGLLLGAPHLLSCCLWLGHGVRGPLASDGLSSHTCCDTTQPSPWIGHLSALRF